MAGDESDGANTVPVGQQLQQHLGNLAPLAQRTHLQSYIFQPCEAECPTAASSLLSRAIERIFVHSQASRSERVPRIREIRIASSPLSNLSLARPLSYLIDQPYYSPDLYSGIGRAERASLRARLLMSLLLKVSEDLGSLAEARKLWASEAGEFRPNAASDLPLPNIKVLYFWERGRTSQ